MKVGGASGPTSAGGPSGVRPRAPASGFSPISAPSAPEAVQTASGVAQVASLDALIALQEVGGPLERRRKAVWRAGGILNALEQLKLDLLDGGLSEGHLEALTRAVREQRQMTEDPRLEGILDEIETRAAVELAKLEDRSVGA